MYPKQFLICEIDGVTSSSFRLAVTKVDNYRAIILIVVNSDIFIPMFRRIKITF